MLHHIFYVIYSQVKDILYFIKPILRKRWTINGVQVTVRNILTGMKTLWQAYAITNVLAPLVAIDVEMLSLTPIFISKPGISRPLKFRKTK